MQTEAIKLLNELETQLADQPEIVQIVRESVQRIIDEYDTILARQDKLIAQYRSMLDKSRKATRSQAMQVIE